MYAARKYLPLVVSALFLLVIYLKIDLHKTYEILKTSQVEWLALILLTTGAFPLLFALRLQLLMPRGYCMAFRHALSLVLAANTLNAVLPCKMGDFIKACFMKRKGHLGGSASLSLVVFEKAGDILALFMLCGIGFLFAGAFPWSLRIIGVPIVLFVILCFTCLYSKIAARTLFAIAHVITPKRYEHNMLGLKNSWADIRTYYVQNPLQAFSAFLISLIIHLIALTQIWAFIICLNSWVPYWVNMAVTPLSAFMGYLPITFLGIGVRDAVLIESYRHYFGASTGAAVGILWTLRIVLLGIGGIPLLGKYLLNISEKTRESEKALERCA